MATDPSWDPLSYSSDRRPRRSRPASASDFSFRVQQSVTPIYGVSASVSLCLAALDVAIWVAHGELRIFDVTHCIALLFSLLGAGLARCCNVKTGTVLCVWTFGLCAAVMLADAEAAAELRIRRWPVLLVLANVAIAWRQRLLMSIVVAATVAYLVVERLESSSHFGLYEVAAGDSMPVSCDCASPPCLAPFWAALQDAVFLLLVLVVNTWFGAWAAAASQSQTSRLERALHVTGCFVRLLDDSATSDAADFLSENQHNLPDDLFEAFERLIVNLETVREYLPDTWGPDGIGEFFDDPEESVALVQPPGVGANEASVCVCFTDVESSTVLWEACPQGMYDALRLHNTVIRSIADADKGYEVKTIGDAFMLAFAQPFKACRFALAAQVALSQQDWPPDLTECELCARRSAPDGTVLWHGLRVRMGMHCGPVRVEISPVTSRCDYFGPTVNVAARVEAAVKRGGFVGVTAAVLESIGTERLSELGNPVVHHLGPKDLKGVKQPVPLSVFVPSVLTQRIKEYLGDTLPPPTVTTDWAQRRKSRMSISRSWRHAARLPMLLAPRSDNQSQASQPMAPTRGLVSFTFTGSSGGPASGHSSKSAVSNNRSNQTTPSGVDHRHSPEQLNAKAAGAVAAPHASELPASTACTPTSVAHQTSGIEAHEPSPLVSLRGLQTPEAARARSGGHGVVVMLPSPLSRVTADPGKFRAATPDLLPGRLRHRHATCAMVRARLDGQPRHDRIQIFVALVEGAADSSQGVLDCVISAGIIVTWNAQKPCVDHVAGCRHFLLVCPREPMVTHAGAASGSVCCGTILSGRRRFGCTIGSCLEMASELAAEAEACKDPVLAVGDVADPRRLDGTVRRAQLWETCATLHAQSQALVVWAVQPQAVTSEYDKWGYLSAELEGQDEAPQEDARAKAAMGDGGRADAPTSIELLFRRVAVLPVAEQLHVLRRAAEGQPEDNELFDLLHRAEAGTLKYRVRPAWIVVEESSSFVASGLASGDDLDFVHRRVAASRAMGSPKES